MYSNANLAGPIPASLTKLTNLPVANLQLQGSPNLCILDADSQLSANKCDGVPCPYPACGCKWAVCPSGGAFNTPAVTANTLNPVSPYYPLVATCCAGTGNTLRERLVTELFLDCSASPCTATAKGLTQVSISYTGDITITGTMPPQIATLTAVTLLRVFNNDEMSGTLPSQLGLMTLVETLYVECEKGVGSVVNTTC
jgi:hypothetical protein